MELTFPVEKFRGKGAESRDYHMILPLASHGNVILMLSVLLCLLVEHPDIFCPIVVDRPSRRRRQNAASLCARHAEREVGLSLRHREQRAPFVSSGTTLSSRTTVSTFHDRRKVKTR